MQTASEFRKKLFVKYSLFTIALMLFYALVYYLFNQFAGETVIDPVIIVVIGMLSPLILLLTIKIYTPNETVVNTDYNIVEKAFEQQCDNLIINYLAAKDYERLIMDDINLIPFEGIQICSEMLNKRDIKNNTEAQFCCYTKLAKYYFRDSEYQKAIDSLKEATLIKADNLVANMRLAELYERVGSGENAIIHYEAALKSKDVISDKLREFVNSQIQIVKTKGPRKKQPPAGYKWMTG